MNVNIILGTMTFVNYEREIGTRVQIQKLGISAPKVTGI